MQDFTTRGNPSYLYQAELHKPFPDWVANQPSPNSDDFVKTASAGFADPARRLLPVTDPVSVFHSAIDLFANMSDYDEAVFGRVKAAAALFGIESDIAPYAELFAGRLEKSASEDDFDGSIYAIDDTINGNRFRLLPLNNAVEVKTSAVDLAKMAAERRIHYLMLWPAAQRIVKAAADHNVNGLPGIVLRCGVERLENLDSLSELLSKRAGFSKLADVEPVTSQYNIAAAEAVEGKCTPTELVEKIAAIDDAAGIAPSYFNKASQLQLPHEIVFNGPVRAEVEKVAMVHVCINDVLIPLDAIKAIDSIEAEFKLSKEAALSLSKHADTEDARDISLAVMDWSDTDRRTLLRLAAV